MYQSYSTLHRRLYSTQQLHCLVQAISRYGVADGWVQLVYLLVNLFVD